MTILIRSPVKSGRKTSKKYADQARLSKRLGEIKVDVPLDVELDECHLGKFHKKNIRELFERLEFASLLNRFKEKTSISIDDISVKELDRKGLENICDKARNLGKLGLTLRLNNYTTPVRAHASQGIISLGEGNLYIFTDINEAISILKPILTDISVKKYILNSKECTVFFKKNTISS